MINQTTFFLEYYMINRTNCTTDVLKSNIYYFSINQSIRFSRKNNFQPPSDNNQKLFLFEVVHVYINYNVQGCIMNLRNQVIISIISNFPDITSKELQERIAILDNYLKRSYI